MPYNALYPVPVACIASPTTYDVDAVPSVDWPETIPATLFLSYSDDGGTTWTPIATFEPGVAQTVTAPGTISVGDRLRFEEPYLADGGGAFCYYGVFADVEVALPADHHLEYVFGGDATGDGPTRNTAALPTQSTTTQSYSATVTVNLVRDVDSAVVCTASDTWSDTLNCPGGYSPPDYGSDVDYGDSATISEACEGTPPPEDCTPPAPVACFDSLSTLALDAVAAADFPSCTTNLKFQTKTGAGAWTDAQTGIVADTAYTVAATIAPNMKARFVSDDGTAGAEIDLLICECETVVLPPDELAIPAIPDAPTLAKSCADSTVTVTTPAFSTAEGAVATSMKARRRLLPDGDWIEDIHIYPSAGSWTDPGTAALGSYEFALRACNAAGCSAWSDAAAIDLISETLALAWQSPAADSSHTGKISLRFSAIDAGGASGLQVFVNGALVGSTPTRKSGTAQNGIYTLVLDTRRAAQGAAIIEVRGVGSDGCKKSATLNLTFANTRASGVLYRDFLTAAANAGSQITRLPLSLWLGALDADPSRRFWGQVAFTKDLSVPVVTSETDPADAQEAFDAMQPFPFSRKREFPALGGNESGTILNDVQTVNAPGAQLKIRVRQEAAERFLAYDTGGETIPKIRQISEGKFLVFAQNPDRVFVFENDALTLLADIQTAEGDTSVTDAALVGDKLYYLNLARLVAYDIDPLTGNRQRTMNISPHGEARRPALIEAVAGKLVALFVDGELETEKTLCVSLAKDQFNDAWTLGTAATLAWSDGADLYFACGGDFYKSAGGVAAPTLIESFDSDITAIAATADAAAIGLADGSLHVLRDAVWQAGVLPGGAAISAITQTIGAFEFLGALWGKAGSATLFGQSAGGGYDVSRALGAYDGVANQPSGVSSLARYFVEGEGEASDDERTLIGTTGGVLLAHSIARQSAASAWLHSSIEDMESGGVEKLIPVEEDE